MANLDLNIENIEEFGFARFYYDGETTGVNGILQREIEFSDDPLLIQKVRISFPSSDLVLLSKEPEEKLVFKDQFQVVSAGKFIDPMYFLSKRAGWNQTDRDLRLFASENMQGNFLGIANIHGTINPLGTGMILSLGDSVCWLGMILVHPELRRQGIANSIMEKCIEVARLNLGKSIIGLDATPQGMQVYENLGFQPSFPIWRSKLSTDATIASEQSTEILPVSSVASYTDLFEGTNLSKKIEGFQLIQNLYPEGVWVAMFKGKSVGLVMTRPGRLNPFIGPLLAITPSIAKALLGHALKYWKNKGYEEVILDVPERHFDNASVSETIHDKPETPRGCILSSELHATRKFIRMYQIISEDDRYNMSATTHIKEPVRNTAMWKHAKDSYEETVDYMKSEIETLKYLYTTGGPEVS
jgi:GNAT superfamily N-acetyltransferase